MKYAIKNCELIPEENAVIPVTNKEYFFNFSVYETLKVVQGKIFFIEDHVKRLNNSATLVGIKHNFAENILIESLHKLIKANNTENGLIRIQLIGGENPLLFMFIVGITFYPKKYHREGIKVVTFEGERFIPGAKSNCLLLNYVAYRKAREEGALEALLIDRNGFVPEGTRSNLFAIKNNTLFTSNEEVLEGVTRKHIISVAKEKGFQIEYMMIPIKKILDKEFDEVFISSTGMGAMPIRQVNDIIISENFEKTNLINKGVKEIYER